jgi:hypothetical protein
MADGQAHHVHSRCAIVPGAVTVNMKVNCAPTQFPPSEKDGGGAVRRYDKAGAWIKEPTWLRHSGNP